MNKLFEMNNMKEIMDNDDIIFKNNMVWKQ